MCILAMRAGSRRWRPRHATRPSPRSGPLFVVRRSACRRRRRSIATRSRAAAIKLWRTPPDFVSVNLCELGWAGIIRAALQAGIGVEAGLASPRDAEELAHSPFAHRLVRALVEVDGGVDEARAIAELVPEGVPQLWHGYGEAIWKIVAAAAADGHDVRIGLEDVLVLPDGRTAPNNT
jgi:uncharacterized protein (DUF849 family)